MRVGMIQLIDHHHKRTLLFMSLSLALFYVVLKAAEANMLLI
jgi:hypothetical protein